MTSMASAEALVDTFAADYNICTCVVTLVPRMTCFRASHPKYFTGAAIRKNDSKCETRVNPKGVPGAECQLKVLPFFEYYCKGCVPAVVLENTTCSVCRLLAADKLNSTETVREFDNRWCGNFEDFSRSPSQHESAQATRNLYSKLFLCLSGQVSFDPNTSKTSDFRPVLRDASKVVRSVREGKHSKKAQLTWTGSQSMDVIDQRSQQISPTSSASFLKVLHSYIPLRRVASRWCLFPALSLVGLFISAILWPMSELPVFGLERDVVPSTSLLGVLLFMLWVRSDSSGFMVKRLKAKPRTFVSSLRRLGFESD